MNIQRLILASASPRRKEILQKYGYVPVIMESGFDEDTVTARRPADRVRKLSRGKALSVAGELQEGDLLIAADTVVVSGGEIFGKPGSEEEAFQMIRRLSGDRHQVYTGVTVIFRKNGQDRIRTFYDRVDVTVREMSDEEIYSYIASGEPFGKAGAYAIQGLFGQFIRRISGDIHTVIGLPGCRTFEVMKELTEE